MSGRAMNGRAMNGRAMRRAPAAPAFLGALVVAAALGVGIGGFGGPFATPAHAGPKPKKEGTPPPVILPATGVITIGSDDGDSAGADVDSVLNGLPRTYQALIRRFGSMTPGDSLGDGVYRLAEAAFTAGRFEEAGKGYLDFARRFPRNLRVNDALSTMLLIGDARDFEGEPLRLYARGRAYRDAGQPDSAAAVLTTAARKFPGAKVRYHVGLLLAQLAQDRGDHAGALQWAIAAADTTGKNRLAPYALKIAAESSVALGEAPQKALGYYKAILERYPDSPITPEARSRALEIRKRMPQ